MNDEDRERLDASIKAAKEIENSALLEILESAKAAIEAAEKNAELMDDLRPSLAELEAAFLEKDPKRRREMTDQAVKNYAKTKESS